MDAEDKIKFKILQTSLKMLKKTNKISTQGGFLRKYICYGILNCGGC